MRLAAHQPQYMPWLGYFDKMDRVDLFVLLDTVQYKKNEWQNRNRIRTAKGWQWLTVPVRYRYPMMIREVGIDETSPWRRKHREALRIQYARAPHVGWMLDEIDPVLREPCGSLAQLNTHTVRILAGLLGVRTPIVLSSSVDGIPQGADDRLIALCHHFGCRTYLAGTGGRDYMDIGAYRRAGIEVEFQSFRHPNYRQPHPGFEPALSAIDCLMNCGSGAAAVMRSAREMVA